MFCHIKNKRSPRTLHIGALVWSHPQLELCVFYVCSRILSSHSSICACTGRTSGASSSFFTLPSTALSLFQLPEKEIQMT